MPLTDWCCMQYSILVMCIENIISVSLLFFSLIFIGIFLFCCLFPWPPIVPKQEAHGPRFAHLRDIATADMQMLCNIFPILSSQLMKILSFEQFWRRIYGPDSQWSMIIWIKLSITFQQKDQCEIWWKLAKWFLKNHDFIHVNSRVAGKYYKFKSDDGHVRFPIRTILTTVALQVTSIFSI